MAERVKAVCVWSGLSVSKEKGTPSIKCKFEPLEGCGRDNDYFYHDLWLTERCMDMTLNTLRGALGWFGDDLYEFHDHHDMLNGVEVYLVIEDETYQGVTRTKVKFVNPVAGYADPVSDLPEAEGKKIAADLKGAILLWNQNNKDKIAQFKSAQPNPPTPKPAPVKPAPVRPMAYGQKPAVNPASTAGDDLPF